VATIGEHVPQLFPNVPNVHPCSQMITSFNKSYPNDAQHVFKCFPTVPHMFPKVRVIQQLPNSSSKSPKHPSNISQRSNKCSLFIMSLRQLGSLAAQSHLIGKYSSMRVCRLGRPLRTRVHPTAGKDAMRVPWRSSSGENRWNSMFLNRSGLRCRNAARHSWRDTQSSSRSFLAAQAAVPRSSPSVAMQNVMSSLQVPIAGSCRELQVM
jgi:hypothetical protein